MEIPFRPFDADNHYYESLDAFTRHQDPKMRHRGVQVLHEGKRAYVVIGGRVNRFIANPTFDPVVVPGCNDLRFRGHVPEGVDPRSLQQLAPLRPEFQDREERLRVMDEQGLAAVLLFPTLGCGVEEALREDVGATMASLSAFNRWLEEDWGFSHLDRIIAAPMLSLADPEAAVVELDSLLERGARIVHVRPAPVPSVHGPRSLGHPAHDPVWARLAEAGIPVAFHLGDSGYNRCIGAAWGGHDRFEPFLRSDVLDGVVIDDRAIYDTMASLIVHGVFFRHPTLRVASIENGSDWVHLLVKRLRKKANQVPAAFPEAPLSVLRRNVWVTPYYEEDIAHLAEIIGVNRVLFGSDWPHGEGLAEPMQFTKELTSFGDGDIRAIMRDNAVELLGGGRVSA